MKKVLILGAYGNFGTRITRSLAAEKDIRVILAGRNIDKLRQLAGELQGSPILPLYHALDIHRELPEVLERLQPDIVIHTSGPFQGQGYNVAEQCIAAGSHYIDLADGRDFVAGIGALDAAARAKGVSVISGASSVPCLSSAILDHYRPRFETIKHVDYGISTSNRQRHKLGLATVRAVLSYAGKTFTTLESGRKKNIYGWQDMALRNYPGLGTRLLANCDIPDLELFPAHYSGLETLRFRAGQQLMAGQLLINALSWLVRCGLVRDLGAHAEKLMKAAGLFDALGSDDSGMHMRMSGTGADGKPLDVTFYLIARQGHGVMVPAIPAILCARMLARGDIARRGAYPCMGVVTLPQYLGALQSYDITTMEEPG